MNSKHGDQTPEIGILRRPGRSWLARWREALGCLSLLRLDVRLILRGYAPLHGFAGFSIRGALGQACALADGRSFEEPALPGSLSARVFEPAPYRAGTNAKPPPPFLVIPPNRPLRGLRAGELLSFQLLLFGDAMEAPLEILLALQRLGMVKGITAAHTPFDVAGADILTPAGPLTLWGPRRRRLVDSIQPAWAIEGGRLVGDVASGRHGRSVARLAFDLPFSLRERDARGRRGLPPRVHLDHLTGSLWRAADAYGHHYGAGGLSIPLETIQSRALRARLTRHALRRLKLGRRTSRGDHPGGQKLSLDCYMGDIAYEGHLDAILPLLTLGQTIGVGRGRCMGLGRYEGVGV